MKPANSFSFKLHALTFTIDKLANEILLKHSDLNFPQFLILLCYVEHPGQSQKFASEWLQLTEATISHMVIKVSKLGYLVVKDDIKDARKRNINPTSKGVTLIRHIYPVLENELAKHLAVIPMSNLNHMIKDMDKIKNSITNKCM